MQHHNPENTLLKKLILPKEFSLIHTLEYDTLTEHIRDLQHDPAWEWRLPTAYCITLSIVPLISSSPSSLEDMLERRVSHAESWLGTVIPEADHEEAARIFHQILNSFPVILYLADLTAAQLALRGGMNQEMIRLLRRAYDLPRSLLPLYKQVFFPFTTPDETPFFDTAAYEAYAPDLATFIAKNPPASTPRHAMRLLTRVERVSMSTTNYLETIITTISEKMLDLNTHY